MKRKMLGSEDSYRRLGLEVADRTRASRRGRKMSLTSPFIEQPFMLLRAKERDVLWLQRHGAWGRLSH